MIYYEGHNSYIDKTGFMMCLVDCAAEQCGRSHHILGLPYIHRTYALTLQGQLEAAARRQDDRMVYFKFPNTLRP